MFASILIVQLKSLTIHLEALLYHIFEWSKFTMNHPLIGGTQRIHITTPYLEPHNPNVKQFTLLQINLYIQFQSRRGYTQGTSNSSC